METEADEESGILEITPRMISKLTTLLTKYCHKCNSIKPPLSHHCSICKRCVSKMDHHCPWVNNCVGYNNQKYFLQFLLYVFVGATHGGFIIGKRMGKEMAKLDPKSTEVPVKFVALTICIFFAFLFACFTFTMFCDQMTCIIENNSTIDKLK